MDDHAMELTGEFKEENGVRFLADSSHDNPTKYKTFYNPKMKIGREFVLASLSAYCDGFKEGEVKSLDAFAETGISGLLWKKHLKDRVEVTVNDSSKDAVQAIIENCKINDFEVDSSFDHVQIESHVKGEDGHESTKPSSSSFKLEVVQEDANIILHGRQFHLIHLDPSGTTVPFLTAAFRSIYNDGILILTSSDVAALYGKCPQVTLRNYNAYITRTEYVKELAVRVVLAQAAKCAAQYNKGFTVLYAVALEHFIQVAVRIQKGATKADACLSHINTVLHCQICEDWAVQPRTTFLHANPYSFLSCSCHSDKSGNAAISLGPVWCGDIFSSEFLQKMIDNSQKIGLSSRLNSLLTTMLSEYRCSSVTMNASVSDTVTASCYEMQEGCRKKLRTDTCTDESMPMFYYNTHKTHFKFINIPKLSRLVDLLISMGFKASRTHFDPTAIRTNAKLSQLKKVLEENCSSKLTTHS